MPPRAPRGRLIVDLLLGLGIAALSLSAVRFDAFGRGDSGGRGGHGMGRDWPGWGPGSGGPGGFSGAGAPDVDLVAVTPWLVAALVVLAAGVTLRRVRPRTGFVLTVIGAVTYLASGHPFGPVLLGPAVGLLAVATRYPGRRWVPWTGLLVPVMWAGFVRESALGLTDPGLYSAVVLGSGLMLVPALIGLIRRNRDDAQRRTRELDLRRSAFEERLRIAREVHDVVGHSLSVITMQAGVALHVLDRRPDQAATSLQAIRSTSKNALDELRATLQVFREADYDAHAGPGFDDRRGPVTGLSRLPELIDGFRAGGRRVDLELPAAPLVVPAAVDLAAYRIIQEALTNVARHTTDAATRVSVRLTRDEPGPEALEVVITDDAGSASGRASTGRGATTDGSGITGMTERAQAVGGRLQAGPRPEGGWQVRAWLPTTTTAAPALDDGALTS